MPRKNSNHKTSTTSKKQADAFSLPDDENENENGDRDDSEFVYEKITLLTADGVVVTNQHGYTGMSTKREMAYAIAQGKEFDVREFEMPEPTPELRG